MKHIANILLIGIAMITFKGNAGIYAWTHHSRANCNLNESTSWFKDHMWDNYRIDSFHYSDMTDLTKPHHLQNSQPYKCSTVHSAIHLLEGNNYLVNGYHYSYKWLDNKKRKSSIILEAVTTATDCSVYDDWWGISAPCFNK